MHDDSSSWMDAWLDDELSAADTAKLNAWIKASPENAAEFAERTHLHSLLHDWAQTKATQPKPKPVTRFRSAWTALAAAAAVVIAATIPFWPKSATPTTAQLIRNPGAQLISTSRDGDSLHIGDYTLPEGLAELLFSNGVEVVIEAPARFRIESNLRLHLHDGRIAASVPPSGIGFTVITPTAEVIDFGTEFGVEVGADESSEVHVFKGEVEVKSSSETVKLLTNDATRLDRGSRSPRRIDVDDERFIRRIDEVATRYSRGVFALKPAAYYRMGISDDTVTFEAAKTPAYSGRLVKLNPEIQPYSTGKVGACIAFTGDSQSVHAQVDHCPPLGSGGFSAAVWVHKKGPPKNATIAARWTTEGEKQFLLARNVTTNTIELQLCQEDGTLVTIADTEPMTTDKWQHFAFVADGKHAILYRNGTEVARAPCGPIADSSTLPLIIGASDRSGKRQHIWRGRIDEFALFDRALTREEIRVTASLQP